MGANLGANLVVRLPAVAGQQRLHRGGAGLDGGGQDGLGLTGWVAIARTETEVRRVIRDLIDPEP